jgi:DNA topoisomerase-1
MEGELDDVANGTLSWSSVLGEFYAPFATQLDSVFKTAEKVKVDLGTTDEKCPTCGAPLAIRISKFGKFLACSTYPACKFTKNIIEKVGIACPKCGADMVVKRTRRGKQFYGCSTYPTCNFAAWKKEDIK